MRRLLATALVPLALLAQAGCSADSDQGRPAASGAPVGAVPSVGASAAQVCAAAQQAGSVAVQTYVDELGRMMVATGASDTQGAEAARQRAEGALTGWRTTLRELSTRATDPPLRTLLTDMADEVEAKGADLDELDETELDRLQQRLDQLCTK
ncbi:MULTISPECIES: hypothetical protein [Micromonospora]|uniref:Lipoprotein n=1 Tax=Micromonospora yangpuensis TaxID=683228 RepID=A0A1C6V4W8_9ACTN|nr:hypothetical protein [Micromonospora yangpuensis]GGM16349.1 hypothetical protein GCM10012279_38100 [Micromonospora yangpuensis]SCL61392.1 hypothetical protein GA0070617_4651 [Micromonospora yangpuensis]